MKDCGSVLDAGVEDHKKKQESYYGTCMSEYSITLIFLVLPATYGKKVPVLKILL